MPLRREIPWTRLLHWPHCLAQYSELNKTACQLLWCLRVSSMIVYSVLPLFLHVNNPCSLTGTPHVQSRCNRSHAATSRRMCAWQQVRASSTTSAATPGPRSNKSIKASLLKERNLNKQGKLSLAKKVQKASGDAANQEEAASTLKPTAGKWGPGYASAGCFLN